MKHFLFLLLISNLAFSTIATDLCWETRNAVMDLKKLYGFPESVLNEEIVHSAHFLRLAQSVMESLEAKGKVFLEWRMQQFSNPGLWIEYRKIRRNVAESGWPDDASFLKTLLGVLGKKVNPEELLKRLHDMGAPSLSLFGERIAYKVWRDGREAVVVEDWGGNIVWKWGISQKEAHLPGDPQLSPDGNIVSFLVGYRLYIKDIAHNRFYKFSLPFPPLSGSLFLYDNPFFYPSNKFVLSGFTLADLDKHWGKQEVDLYFISTKGIAYSLRLDLAEKLNLLWAPNQEKLAILFEEWKEWSKCHKDIWLIDVPKRKTYKLKLNPAHYSFVWDRNSNGIYLATKGKEKGEIFYLSLRGGRISRLFKCGEGMEIFNLQEDGTLLLKKGREKLLAFRVGEKPREIKASFHKFMLNQSASPGPCCCAGWGGPGCYNLAGPFPTNCIEIAVAEGILPQKSELFSYPHNTQGERVWIRKVILTPQLYKRLEETMTKEHPIYWDVHPQRGIAILTSPNGGCAKLLFIPFFP